MDNSDIEKRIGENSEAISAAILALRYETGLLLLNSHR